MIVKCGWLFPLTFMTVSQDRSCWNIIIWYVKLLETEQIQQIIYCNWLQSRINAYSLFHITLSLSLQSCISNHELHISLISHVCPSSLSLVTHLFLFIHYSCSHVSCLFRCTECLREAWHRVGELPASDSTTEWLQWRPLVPSSYQHYQCLYGLPGGMILCIYSNPLPRLLYQTTRILFSCSLSIMICIPYSLLKR